MSLWRPLPVPATRLFGRSWACHPRRSCPPKKAKACIHRTQKLRTRLHLNWCRLHATIPTSYLKWRDWPYPVDYLQAHPPKKLKSASYMSFVSQLNSSCRLLPMKDLHPRPTLALRSKCRSEGDATTSRHSGGHGLMAGVESAPAAEPMSLGKSRCWTLELHGTSESCR